MTCQPCPRGHGLGSLSTGLEGDIDLRGLRGLDEALSRG